tara:strand:+ start:2729 stop:2950 length:222 start_codon:yes stop_codon:yes gene_type:complete
MIIRHHKDDIRGLFVFLGIRGTTINKYQKTQNVEEFRFHILIFFLTEYQNYFLLHLFLRIQNQQIFHNNENQI